MNPSDSVESPEGDARSAVSRERPQSVLLGGDSTESPPRAEITTATLRYLEQTHAPNTREAYRRDWARWQAWAYRVGVQALPADPVDVANFIAEAADPHREDGQPAYKPSTLARWVAGIDAVHKAAEAEHPDVRPPGTSAVVRRALQGIRRDRAAEADAEQVRQAQPILLSDVRTMLAAQDYEHYPDGVAARRDAVILLLGFAGAFRPSELTALNLGSIEWHLDDGLHVHLVRSKTDQDGSQAHVKGIPRGRTVETCAPCAVLDWVRLRAAVANERLPAPSSGRPRRSRERVVAMSHMTPRPDEHLCLVPPGRAAAEAVVRLSDAFRQPHSMSLLSTVHRAGRIGYRPSPDVVDDVVKRRRARAGLVVEGYSGHSMRVGALTTAARAGASVPEMQALSGHRAAATVERYVRRRTPLERNAVTVLGL
nr:site-specific integrase [Luteipulveratus halotolerans]